MRSCEGNSNITGFGKFRATEKVKWKPNSNASHYDPSYNSHELSTSKHSREELELTGHGDAPAVHYSRIDYEENPLLWDFPLVCDKDEYPWLFKEEGQPPTCESSTLSNSTKVKATINPFLAYRSFYCRFMTGNQKEISSKLSLSWRNEPNKKFWEIQTARYNIAETDLPFTEWIDEVVFKGNLDGMDLSSISQVIEKKRNRNQEEAGQFVNMSRSQLDVFNGTLVEEEMGRTWSILEKSSQGQIIESIYKSLD